MLRVPQLLHASGTKNLLTRLFIRHFGSHRDITLLKKLVRLFHALGVLMSVTVTTQYLTSY